MCSETSIRSDDEESLYHTHTATPTQQGDRPSFTTRQHPFGDSQAASRTALTHTHTLCPPCRPTALTTRFVSPRVGTWNVTTLTDERLDYLLRSVRKSWTPDIWCLQEVKLRESDTLRLTKLSQLGSTFHSPHPLPVEEKQQEQPHVSGGLAIVVNHQANDLIST